LQGLARKEWLRMAPLLYDAGLLTKIDVTALATYCQCYARWCEAEEEIRRTGTVIKTTKGQPMLSPFLKVANIALQQLMRMLVEFGMSPSSRSRVTVAKGTRKEDEFEKFLTSGGIKIVPKAK
jgi:P27 family predicted phage terminase small subunit